MEDKTSIHVVYPHVLFKVGCNYSLAPTPLIIILDRVFSVVSSAFLSVEHAKPVLELWYNPRFALLDFNGSEYKACS